MDDKAYRKLEVWKQAMDLVEMIYHLTAQLPTTERFGLVSQMQRAAMSIPSNIAEGYGRDYRKEYVRFLSNSRGSLMELETQLIAIVRLKLLNRKQVLPVWKKAQDVGRMLTALIKSLRTTPSTRNSDQTPDPSN